MQVLDYIVTFMREDRPHSDEEYNTMPLNDTKITLRGALSSFPIALSTILWRRNRTYRNYSDENKAKRSASKDEAAAKAKARRLNVATLLNDSTRRILN